MKFLHTGDLHIGKTINDFPMIHDQRYILSQITDIAIDEKADAVVLAGDIYDRAIPSAEAVVLFNDFLTGMVRKNIPVLIISGNHDSPERLGFADEILKEKNIYIAGVYDGKLKEVTFTDAYGKVTFVLLPYIKAAAAGEKTNEAAVSKILTGLDNMQKKRRYILATHYFVTNSGREPELSDAEMTVHVGGLDNVEAALFDKFEYTALGHIHKAQRIKESIYYAGAPLAYSFSEVGTAKTVNIVDMKEKGNIAVNKINLMPLHEMRIIKGSLEELMKPDIVSAANTEDYIQARLTNKEELIDPIGTLRAVYPNIMQIVLLKNERNSNSIYESKVTGRKKSISELFTGFYETVREEEPDEERKMIIDAAAKEAEGGQAK